MARDNRSKTLDDTADLPDLDDTIADFHAEAGQDELDLSADYAPADDITLESILAEYKGSAYIAGDKKTPSDLLQEKTDKIVMETTGKPSALLSPEDEPFTPEEYAERTKPLPSLEEIRASSTKPLPSLGVIKVKTEPEKAPEKEPADNKRRNRSASAPIPTPQQEIISFEQYNKSEPAQEKPVVRNRFAEERNSRLASERTSPPVDDIAREVEMAIERQTKLEEETEKTVRKVFGLFGRRAPKDVYDEYDDDVDEDTAPQPVRVIEEEVFEEPDYRAAVRKFAEKCNLYSLRSFISLILSLVMALLTILYMSDISLPFGFSDNRTVNNGVLLILLFIVMMFSVDHLISGLLELFKGKNGLDALNLFSCLATAASCAFTLITKKTGLGVPFCAVSAFSLTFTLWGEKIYYRAMTETMKTALSVGVPYGVIAEISRDLDKTVVKKVPGRTSGFYNNLVQADVTEIAYNYAAPIMIVSAAVLGLYSSLGLGNGQYFLHNFAAIMAAAAPFSAVFAYAMPLTFVNRRARQSGAAIAGWGGADDLSYSDGASITDEDLFPPGNVTISGIKIFEEISPEKALRFTASLIIASNSGLSKLFSELLSKQGMNLSRVEDFTCYEGGIGGNIRGERVYTGSAAFMNLQGIRVPAGLNNKNAVFSAVNKKLIAVFSIDYIPVKTVQSALVSILKYRIKLYFAIRDFNITPVMLEQKYKISLDNVEYIPIKDSYDISDDNKQEAKRVSAVLTREGMGPYVEAITGGRRLRSTALLATVFSILFAAGGMLIMFAICCKETFSVGNPGNLLLYMLSMLFIVIIVCGFAKYRR